MLQAIHTKRVLIFLVFVLLLLPHLQNYFRLFEVRDLKGSFVKAADVSFEYHDWFRGTFQERREKYLSENFGLRNTMVRVSNQVRFMLFRSTSNVETVIGKEDELFTKAYIESYTGENFMGADAVEAKCRAIKSVQAKMAARGKIFLPVIAPNKARAHTHLLPDGTREKGLSNYEGFRICFDKLGVTYIDFNRYFADSWKSSQYPLFSRYGVHWSSYGQTLAADSIVRFINSRYGLRLPGPQWRDRIFTSDSLREFDYDAGEGLNLLTLQLPSQPMAYALPVYNDNGAEKPPVLVVGDSFTFGLELTGLFTHAFSDYLFLYYFRERLPYTADKDAFAKLNFNDELDRRKVFLVVTTEHNLINYGWGFVEKLNKALDGQKVPMVDEEENNIRNIEYEIRNDQGWLSELKSKAEETHLPLDSVIRRTAVAANAKRQAKRRDPAALRNMIEFIRSNGQWMNDVKARARQRGITVDSALVGDARWALEHER